MKNLNEYIFEAFRINKDTIKDVSINNKSKIYVEKDIQLCNAVKQVYKENEPLDLTHIDVSGLDLNSKKNVFQEFFYDNNFTKASSIDISDWDLSNANLYGMFSYLETKEIIIDDINTKGVINMQNMFLNSQSLIDIHGIENLDVSSVSIMDSMFQYCKGIKKLDLSNWDTKNLISTNLMFYSADNLTEVNIKGWDLTNLKKIRFMFAFCKSLKHAYGFEEFDKSYMTNKQLDYLGIFKDCGKLQIHNIPMKFIRAQQKLFK